MEEDHLIVEADRIVAGRGEHAKAIAIALDAYMTSHTATYEDEAVSVADHLDTVERLSALILFAKGLGPDPDNIPERRFAPDIPSFTRSSPMPD